MLKADCIRYPPWSLVPILLLSPAFYSCPLPCTSLPISVLLHLFSNYYSSSLLSFLDFKRKKKGSFSFWALSFLEFISLEHSLKSLRSRCPLPWEPRMLRTPEPTTQVPQVPWEAVRVKCVRAWSQTARVGMPGHPGDMCDHGHMIQPLSKPLFAHSKMEAIAVLTSSDGCFSYCECPI